MADVASDAIFLGASWGEEGNIVYSQMGKGIMQVSAGGGTPETLIGPEKDGDMYHPRLLPDGKSVLFTLGPAPYRVAVQPIKSSNRKILFPGDCAWYLRTGHIVYGLDNSLYAAPFDLNTLQSGASVPVVEGLYRGDSIYPPQYAVSGSGTLVYVPKAMAWVATKSTLVWVDRNGNEERTEAPSNVYGGIRISPDDTRVALAAAIDGNWDIYIWDLSRRVLSKRTFNKSSEYNPIWTQDGKRIVFTSDQGDVGSGIYWKPADGMGKDVLIEGSLFQFAQIFPSSWSGDGKTLVLTGNFFADGRANYDIGILDPEGDSKYKPLLKEKHNESQPQVSPNGHWMAYVSNESGQAQIYVRPFPEADAGCWQVSMSGGNSPLWSRDGHELFYRSGDAVMAVPVETEPSFSFETPKPLFRRAFRRSTSTSANQWDVSPDGKFLMIKDTGVTAPTLENALRINIVLNWFEELKEKVPLD